MTEGERLLRALPDTATAIAERIDVTRATVSNWRAGRSKPRKAQRRLLRAHYGIPAHAWDHPADAAPGWASGLREPLRKPPSPSPVEEIASEAQSATTLAGVTEHLRRIEGHLEEDLSQSERLKFLALKTAALKLRASLEHAAEVTEDRVVRQHPKWRAIREGLRRVLADYPEARTRVVEMLRELEV